MQCCPLHMECEARVKVGEKHLEWFKVEDVYGRVVLSHHGCLMCSQTPH